MLQQAFGSQPAGLGAVSVEALAAAGLAAHLLCSRLWPGRGLHSHLVPVWRYWTPCKALERYRTTTSLPPSLVCASAVSTSLLQAVFYATDDCGRSGGAAGAVQLRASATLERLLRLELENLPDDSGTMSDDDETGGGGSELPYTWEMDCWRGVDREMEEVIQAVAGGACKSVRGGAGIPAGDWG